MNPSPKSAAVAEAAVAVADVTMEYSGPVVDAVGLAAKNAASSAAAAAGAAVDAGSATIEFISNIDPIEVKVTCIADDQSFESHLC